jgi:septal ring-binding cell division protein DamX
MKQWMFSLLITAALASPLVVRWKFQTQERHLLESMDVAACAESNLDGNFLTYNAQEQSGAENLPTSLSVEKGIGESVITSSESVSISPCVSDFRIQLNVTVDMPTVLLETFSRKNSKVKVAIANGSEVCGVGETAKPGTLIVETVTNDEKSVACFGEPLPKGKYPISIVVDRSKLIYVKANSATWSGGAETTSGPMSFDSIRIARGTAENSTSISKLSMSYGSHTLE